MKYKIYSIIALVAVLTFSGFGCKKTQPQYSTSLEVWGVFDDSGDYQAAFNAFNELNPNIRGISYKKFTIENYEKDLLEALAAGNGPDIFMIHNTWLPAFGDKIVPVSPAILNEQDFRDNLVDVAVSDFMQGSTIYGVPMSVDSLGLYYNKDLFNAAGIVTPPATWQEFNEAIKKITRVDDFGNITQQGATIGTAYNINRSTDILALLMMQEGSEISSASGSATFDDAVIVDGRPKAAGQNALRFYTQFARSTSPLYTWNKRQDWSLDAFGKGTAAMTINYSWHYETIKQKNEKLNFAVAPVPQLAPDAPVNIANYWGFAVAKNKEIVQQNLGEDQVAVSDEMRIHEAWQFLRFLAMPNNGTTPLTNFISGETLLFPTEIDPAKVYLEQTQKPAARRDLVAAQKTDPIVAPFATGNLIARSWVQPDASANESILAEAIDAVNIGQSTIADALDIASSRISQLAR